MLHNLRYFTMLSSSIFLFQFNLLSNAYRGVYTSNNSRPTVVVIGTGWGGIHFIKSLKSEHCNLIILSQRNHMLFTPLLPQTCTGTLEFRSICEPLNKVYPQLSKLPNIFYRSMAYNVDFDDKIISGITVGVNDGLLPEENIPVRRFDLKYDYLVFAHGAVPNTFNIPGVFEHTFFLREVHDARSIRCRLLQNLMTAELPTTTIEEMKRLLHIVVVGGGPTGIEFAADMLTFFQRDLLRVEPGLRKYIKLTILEGMEILGSFDKSLKDFAAERLHRMGATIQKVAVKKATPLGVEISDGSFISSGLVVWSTGVTPGILTKALNCDKAPRGRILIDDYLRILRGGKPVDNVFAIGDCAANHKELPTLAAVACRQGKFLSKTMNKMLSENASVTSGKPFSYTSLGSICSLGNNCAIVDGYWPFKYQVKGFIAFLYWRLAYLSMLITLRTKLYVCVNWIGSALWGRDLTYISSVNEFKQFHQYVKLASEKGFNKLKADTKDGGQGECASLNIKEENERIERKRGDHEALTAAMIELGICHQKEDQIVDAKVLIHEK